MKTASRWFFIICLLGIMITVLIVTFSNKDIVHSFYENRVLEAVPAFAQDTLTSGEYFDSWENWLTDHAAGRNTILKINTWLELNLLRLPVVNNVVVQDDVLLGFNKYGKWDTDYLEENSVHTAEKLREFSDYIEAMDGKFYYVGIPEQFSYFYQMYPEYMENRGWVLDPLHADFSQAMQKYCVNYVNICEEYEALNKPKEYYFLTDHHYSFYGALAAYKALLNRINEDNDMNLKIMTDEDMEIMQLPNPYLGSRNRKLYGMRNMGEHAAYAVLNDPIPYSRWDNGKQTDAPVFAMPNNDEKTVNYDFYMGKDYAETIICTNREQLPNALIFGDSFTNAMETLLYTAFNETRSLDMRHYTAKTLREYIAEYRPDIVICIRDDTAFFLETGNGNLN